MGRVIGSFAAVALTLAIAAAPAPAADEVLSGNVREADNKSGQNTNAGSGIKTNHIQNSAVTSAKIKDGQVGTADLANGAVTSAKIKDGNVLAADLANGSVTASKVGFYSRVVIVDVNGGGDFTSPVAAMASITDASAANPYLVKLMPGVYDVGQDQVVMKDHVDIEGSGVGVTTIKGDVPSDGWLNPRGLVAAASGELRFLSVENLTQAGGAIGFHAPYSDIGNVFSLLHVRVRAQGAQTAEITAAVFVESPTPILPARLSHVRAEGVGGTTVCGIYTAGAHATLSDVEATAWEGAQRNLAIWNNGGRPSLRRVTATAEYPGSGSGGLGNVGVYNQGALADLRDVTAFAANNAMSNDGVRNDSAVVRLAGVTAEGEGSSSYGLKNVAAAGSYTVTADRCEFKGGFGSIHNNSEFSTRVGGSKLAGVLNGSGSAGVTCAASYSASYKALEADCLPVGCVRAAGTFDLGGPTPSDAVLCEVLLNLEAGTTCCSGSLASPFFQEDPPLCRGTCN